MPGREENRNLRQVLDDALAAGAADDPVAGLTAVVDWLRPDDVDNGEAQVLALCDRLEAGEETIRLGIGGLVFAAIERAQCVHALTEAGMPSDDGFLSGLSQRMGRRLLPDVDDPLDLGAIVRKVFWHKRDYQWLATVEEASWRRLLDLLGLNGKTLTGVPHELASSVRVLASHTSSLGLSPAVTHLLPRLDDLDSPMLSLPDHVRLYTQCFDDPELNAEELLDRALATLKRCRDSVLKLRADKHVHGTSLRLTTLSFRLLKQTERLELLLHLTEPVTKDFQAAAFTLLKEIVEAQNTRNHITRHIRDSADLLAYQVVEHAAKKGSKYITTTVKDYWRFFGASCLGGLIVAVFALFKLLSSKLDMSLAGEAFVYSINYSLCFVMIYLFGGALATKQPAMTANTIAKAMDGPGGQHALEQIAEMVVRVWRSQFISFAGNLIAAFPMALLLAELYRLAVGVPPAGPEKSQLLLADVHPWESGALFFAAVAGFFLFIAGLVSGYFDNRNLYRKLSVRIGSHPLLVKVAGPDRSKRVGKFVDKHGGALVGNVFLGFCLGTAGTFGVIFGLPFDIRHIAFSSANVGFALEGATVIPAASVIGEAALGVILIGFVNFLVSFGLMLNTAMASRHITLRENAEVLRILLRRVVRRPWDYFFPPRTAPSESP